MATTAFELQARIGIDSTEYERGLNNSKGALSSFGDFAGDIFKKAASAFADFVADSVRTGAEFDKTMSQVAATMGQTTEEVQNLSDFAKELGATTAFSAQQAAEGLNYMALAGYDAEKSMEMLPKVLDLAAAGCMELGQASDMVTDAASALQLDAEGTTAMIDQMAKAAASSNTSVSQLGEAILQVGGTAKDLKGGTVELTSVLGILADNGMKGAVGGTALRNMMNSLISPTKDAQEVLGRFGISLFDSEGEMRGLNEVFADLGKSLDGLSTKDRKQAIAALFNARDMKAAEALMANATKRFDELSNKIMESEGAAAEMAETQLDNLAGDVTLFKSGLEGLKIAISDEISPFLRDFVQGATSSIGDISKLIENLSGAFRANGFRGLSTMIDLELDTVRSRMRRFIDELLPTISQEITNFTSQLPSKILDIANKLTNPENLKPFGEVATTIVHSLVDGLFSQDSLDVLSDTENGVPKLIGNICENLANGAELLLDGATEIIKNLVKYFLDPENKEKIKSGAQDILVALGDAFVQVVGVIHHDIVDLMSDIMLDMAGSADYDATAAEILGRLAKALLTAWGNHEILKMFPLYSLGNQLFDNPAYVNSLEDYNNSDFTGTIHEWYGEEGEAWRTRQSMSNTYSQTASSLAQGAGGQAAYDAYMRSVRGYAAGFDAVRPTYLNSTMVGEKGEEVLLPLDSNTAWMDKLSDRLGSRMNGVIIQFGDIIVHGSEDIGQKVISQLDSALRQYQIMQSRGIGGTGWA